MKFELSLIGSERFALIVITSPALKKPLVAEKAVTFGGMVSI